MLRLDTSAGKLTKIAESEAQFRQMAETKEKREEWFAESDEKTAASRGLNPNTNQCIAFAMPLAFVESASNNKPFVVDIYEQVLATLAHCTTCVTDAELPLMLESPA